jgi:ubiquinone biosynthesis protein UbiJ
MEQTDLESLTGIVKEIERNVGGRVDAAEERVADLESDVERLRKRVTKLEER